MSTNTTMPNNSINEYPNHRILPEQPEIEKRVLLVGLRPLYRKQGLVSTFVSGNSKSFIDATCSTESIAAQILDWEMLEAETLTEHRFIAWLIKGEKKMKMSAI